MSELVVVFLLCACGVILVVSHGRALAGSAAHQRELDRLLGAIDRACADFLWQETRLLGLLLLGLGAVLSLPVAVWHAQPLGTSARMAAGVLALLLGGAAGAGVARATHWAALRATTRALAELRDQPQAASTAVFRGAALAALLTDAASLLVSCACFAAHYAHLTAVSRLDPGTALLTAARSAPSCALGATCAAAIFQIGGSSFQTAASVAASGARARDRRLALDDEQNPALIAELVGNYVGGVVFRSTDVFAALMLANSILIALSGAVFQANAPHLAGLPAAASPLLALLALPVLVRATGALAAAISLGSLRLQAELSPARALGLAGAGQATIAAAGLLGAALWLLGAPLAVSAFGAGMLGIAGSLICQGLLLAPRALGRLSLVPATPPGEEQPVTSMARALGLGLQRSWAPLLVAGACLGAAYAIGSRMPLQHGGAYALVLALAGLLGSAALPLCSSAFSSIGASVRRIGALRRGHYDLAARGQAAELERSARAIGNWGDTQCILTGTAAALLGAVCLPLSAPVDPATSSDATARAAGIVPLLGVGYPIVLVGGMLGITSLSFYVGGVLGNSSRSASALEEELSKEHAALSEAEARSLPSYRGSVLRAAGAATNALLPLAAAALLAPMVFGLLLRLIYGPAGARYVAHGLMALAAVAVLTGACAALAAQGALTALGLLRRAPGGDAGPLSGVDAAREFVGHSVGPAALVGLKATVVSALAIAPLLFPSSL